MQNSQDAFREKGVALVALSYDSPEILKEFAQRHKIDFPLLSDPKSEYLEQLKLVNPEAKGLAKGVAFPGLIYLNAKGQIVETFFEDSYTDRPTPGTVLAKLFPDWQADAPQESGKDYRLVQTGASGIAGSQWELVVEFPLPPTSHLYAPGNTSYQALTLELEDNPRFEFGEVQYPASENLTLEAIGETVDVFSGPTRIRVPVKIKVSDDNKKLKETREETISGVLKYQICTDTVCRMPVSESVHWKTQIKPFNRTRAEEKWRHTE